MRIQRLCTSTYYVVLIGLALFSHIQALGGEKPRPVFRSVLVTEFTMRSDSFERPFSSSRLLLQPAAAEEKSVLKAVAYSLLLPGMGELYAGGFDSGKYFLIAESGLWLTFTSFELYGNWLQNDARKFAAGHSAASVDGKDDQFFVNIGNFNNVYDYNEKKLRDRDLGGLYDVSGPFFWRWDSDQSRMKFRDLRVKSDNVINNVRFVVGAIIINHIASAVNAARIAIRGNKGGVAPEWDVQAGVLGGIAHPNGVAVTLRKNF